MRTATLQRYAPDLTPCRIDLSDNTNAWGMPPAAQRAIAGAELTPRYPTPYGDDLKAAIASYTGMPVEMIVTGCGSDDVLDSAIRALGRPGERLAFVTPTFVMIPAFAQLNGLVPVPVASFTDLATSGGRILYVCSPNNPTGAVVTRGEIEGLLGATRDDQVVLVDEAYAEFAGASVVDLTRMSDRVVVTRTMSKAFGLAGLRVGYGIARAKLVAAIETSRGPYKVSSVSERAAVAALSDGRDWMTTHVTLAIESRERLAVELRARGLEPLESAANFLFVPVANAVALAARLVGKGIRVRGFSEPSGLRITVGPWPVMQDVLDALDEVRQCE
jgi:histidinol-phosphate aminotransferase